MEQVNDIIDHLTGRLIPEEIELEGATPPGYEEKLQGAYQKRMKRRAHRILQSISPSDRRSILNFLENEEDVREAKNFLDELGYSELSVQKMNGMARRLIHSKESVINQAHLSLLEENELMGVFVGGATEARVSSHRQSSDHE